MVLTSVRVELAAKGSETSDQANHILRVFKEPGFSGYPFNVDSKPAIICVGYVGDRAVTAAACYEDVMVARQNDDETKLPFIGLPSVGVSLIATETGHKRNGYSTQLVHAVLNLATSHTFDRVEAVQPSGDEAKLFWGACGFKPLPFKSFGHHDMYRGTGNAPLENISTEVTISNQVHQRLANFVQVQAGKLA